jgi:ABC-type transport system involved in multi-copper enzyme maturation permease subunit
MNITNKDLPATLQAFELQDDKEVFLAEQLVNSQSEVEIFTTRYAGKLIKAEKVPGIENRTYAKPVYKKERSSSGLITFIIVLAIVALFIYGFSTGWIQEKLHFKL